MWSPTTNTNTDSDNKKKENVEEGKGQGIFCASAVGAAASDAAVAKQTNINHPTHCSSSNLGSNNLHNKDQELNDFNNSKKQQQHCEETADSGYISGAISSSIIDSEELQQEKDTVSTSELIPKLTSLNIQSGNIGESKQQENYSALDSGCIVSEQLSEDEKISTDQQKQVSKELSNATVADASVAANPMIFKHKVDANISEWFCNQTLQSDQTSTTGLNNLSTTQPRSSDHLNQNQNQNQNQQQQQQSSQRNTSTKQQTQQNTTTGSINPSNAWERFYQQNEEGDTPLHIACAFGEEDIVAALIRMVPHPCLFNIQNDEGQTALHIAARAKQPKILRMLLIAGAEPVIRDCRGNTALHLACDAGEMQCVRALTMEITQSEVNEAHRQYGHRSTDNTMSFLKFAQLPSDLEIRNYDGERCVHIAAQKGHLEILRVLELFGADMNSREGRSGYTPLHIAILCNNDEIINFLLNECKNLNLEAMTYAGRTAYQIADALDKCQMTNILKERGAEPLTPPESDYDSSDLESDDEKEQDWFGDHQFFANYTLMVA